MKVKVYDATTKEKKEVFTNVTKITRANGNFWLHSVDTVIPIQTHNRKLVICEK